MAIYLTENDVDRLLGMDACIEGVEQAFLEAAAGRAPFKPRARVLLPQAMLHVLPAGSERLGRMSVKCYATTRAGAKFVVLLFDANTSDLLAMMEADRLGQRRTGAASGVATRRMARKDATTLAILGTGWQARSQVEAIARVRKLKEIRAWGRDRGRLIERRSQGPLHVAAIFGMNSRQPLFRSCKAGLRPVAQHGLPSGRIEDLAIP